MPREMGRGSSRCWRGHQRGAPAVEERLHAQGSTPSTGSVQAGRHGRSFDFLHSSGHDDHGLYIGLPIRITS